MSFSRWPSFLGKRCAYNQQTDLDLHLIGGRCQLFGCGDLQVRTNEHTASMQWIGDILFLYSARLFSQENHRWFDQVTKSSSPALRNPSDFFSPPLKMAFWSGKIWENDEPLDYRWLSSHLSKCIIHHGHPGIHCIFSGSSASQSCVGNESTPGGSRFPRTGWWWGFWSWRIVNWLLHKYMHIYIVCIYIYIHTVIPQT